jgi:hypothetical protein
VLRLGVFQEKRKFNFNSKSKFNSINGRINRKINGIFLEKGEIPISKFQFLSRSLEN